MPSIGLKIKELRKEKGWSMDRLGEQLGKTSSSINGYEKGKNEPPLEIIVKLSQIFDVTVDYLMSDRESIEQFNLKTPEGRREASNAIIDNSKYSREEQKALIHQIKMRTSQLPDVEKVELLINELMLMEQKLLNEREINSGSLPKEMWEDFKKKFKMG